MCHMVRNKKNIKEIYLRFVCCNAMLVCNAVLENLIQSKLLQNDFEPIVFANCIALLDDYRLYSLQHTNINSFITSCYQWHLIIYIFTIEVCSLSIGIKIILIRAWHSMVVWQYNSCVARK